LVAIHDHFDFNLDTIDYVLQDLVLHANISHDACSLQVLVQDDTLKAHLVLIICILRVINALISTD
jgi:hypothetical protein